MKLLGFAGCPADAVEPASWVHYQKQLGFSPLQAATADGHWALVASGPHTYANSVCCVVVGKPTWQVSGATAAGAASPAVAIHAAYTHHGVDFLRHITGTFALAIIDLSADRVILAIDRMGVEKLAYAVSNGQIAFGSSAEHLARSPLCRFAVRQQGLYDFLLMHMIPAPDTIFEGVMKLRPGTAVVFERQLLTVHRYWQPRFAEGRSTESFDSLQADLHYGLTVAVTEAGCDERTGAFLSGGLDSSTVAGLLAKVTGSGARTFSMGFGVDSFDELHYARIASRHFGCRPFEYNVTPSDVVAAFPLIAGAYDEPFGNSSAVPTYICALRAAEQGITHLLAGDGGDELFGGNERYVRHSVFERYQRVPQVLRGGLIEPLARLISADSGFTLLRKARSYLDQARIPLPERLESWNYIYNAGAGSLLEPEFALSIDPQAPFSTMRDVYNAAPARSVLHKMLYYDWHFTLSDNDLRKVGLMCEMAGVSVSYPMLDHRVIDVSLRIPPREKIRGGKLRSFYKAAMRDFLPAEILNKSKHGFGLPFGEWLKVHEGLANLIYSHLQNLKRRHFVRKEFIDHLIDCQRRGHASYYGYAIWDLAMLEAWMQAHGL
jgi:asparagine synthase (glutamine-hydrolysing)